MERKKQFGLFASIGTTRKQLRHTVFFEALIVGTIGIILGIISAYIGIGTVILIVNNLLKNAINIPLELCTYPLFIIIPCHRVIGADGSLTGYGGGLPMKKALLMLEKKHGIS